MPNVGVKMPAEEVGFPRLKCRGLIEADADKYQGQNVTEFPRLKCRGLIEALLATTMNVSELKGFRG